MSSQHADALLARGTDLLAYPLKERVGDITEPGRALSEVCAKRTALDLPIVRHADPAAARHTGRAGRVVRP